MTHIRLASLRRVSFYGLVFIAILVAVYLLNFITPLRLTHDSLRYFSLEEWLERGFTAGSGAARDYLPYGYVFTLFGLSKLHLLHTLPLVLVNFLFLFGALWFNAKLFAREGGSWKPMLILVLLNWMTIKFVLTPLSEMQYLFFSSGTLYFFGVYLKEKKASRLLGGLLFFAAAILTRTIAIVLLVAFLMSILQGNKTRSNPQMQKRKWVLVSLLAAMIGATLFFSTQLRIFDYLAHFARPLKLYGFSGFFQNFWPHPMDWAEAVINAPFSKIVFIPLTPRAVLYMGVGLVSIAWLFYLMFKRESRVPVLIKYYLLLYFVVVFNWPFHEGRFWLPIVPLVVMVVLQGPVPKAKLLFGLYTLAKWTYVFGGIYALSYYSYTSWNKEAFAQKQSAGTLKNEYETHFFGRPLGDTAVKKNEEVMYFLKKID
jgi:hypothetical protein